MRCLKPDLKNKPCDKNLFTAALVIRYEATLLNATENSKEAMIPINETFLFLNPMQLMLHFQHETIEKYMTTPIQPSFASMELYRISNKGLDQDPQCCH